MKKYIIFIIISTYVLSVHAQGLGHSSFLNSKNQSSNTTGANERIFNPNKKASSTSANSYNKGNDKGIVSPQKNIADSAYYARFIKKNGWFEGCGRKLTLEEASHLSCYYKFSKKNSAGHWTLMQAYNGYGQLTIYHNYSAYILNQFDEKDTGANKQWREKMQSMCQLELIGSNDGKEVVQERALDAFGNVVFVGIPTRTGHNKFLYSYIDSWGRPIYVRTDSLGNDLGYANFVEVTRDERGFEVLFRYTDRNGIPAKNIDGAFMNKKEYDDNGNVLKHMSLNVLGNLMIDDFGNCGMQCTYDTNGNTLTAMSYNAEWKPESLSGTNNRSSNTDGTCGYWFKYDDYGREIERGYLDTLGHKCTNRFGAYRITSKYDNNGNVLHLVSYDKAGNKVAMDSIGIAEQQNIIKDGYYISTISLNPIGKFINNADGFCKKTWTYINDVEREETEYTFIEDSIHVKFHYECDSIGNKMRYWVKDDLLRVDSVNERGEETLLVWYDLKHKPKNWWGFHRRVSNYQYENKKRILTRTWFDIDGNYAEEQYSDGDTFGYTSQILVSDTIAHTETQYRYVNNLLKEAYVQEKDETMSTILAQYDITQNGSHSRVGWFDNFHYRAKIDMDYNGNIKSFIGTNEFGEPSYLSSLDGDLVYHYFYKINDNYIYYDEYGNQIDRNAMSTFISKLPSVYCIEITDTAKANIIGIKDNDIILSYGDWYVSEDLKTDKDYFYLELILKKSKGKRMTILRHHPENNCSEIIHFTLQSGSLKQFGFYPHTIYYTHREKQRLIEIAEAWNFEFGIGYKKGVHDAVLVVPLKGSISGTPMYWQHNRTEPHIIVAADQQSPLFGTKNYWFADVGTHEDFAKKQMLSASVNAVKHAILSNDLETLTDEKWDQPMGSSLIPISICDMDYDKLLKLCREYKQDVLIDTVQYDWRQNAGNLSIQQLSDSLQIINDGINIKEKGKVIRDSWEEMLSPFSRVIMFYFDKDASNPLNQEAVRLIGKLNKRNYIELRSSTINSTLYIARKESSKKSSYYTEALCVVGQNIYIFEGLFTKEQLLKVWK